MKYKFIGTAPVLVIEYHVELQPGDIVELDGVVDNPLLVPYVETTKETKKGVSE